MKGSEPGRLGELKVSCWLAVDTRQLRKGYGGVVAAGYWDESWQPAPNSAYFRC